MWLINARSRRRVAEGGCSTVAHMQLNLADITLQVANGNQVVPKSFVEVLVKFEGKCKLLQLYLVDDPEFPMLFGPD